MGHPLMSVTVSNLSVQELGVEVVIAFEVNFTLKQTYRNFDDENDTAVRDFVTEFGKNKS
jgi:hypothetical protein